MKSFYKKSTLLLLSLMIILGLAACSSKSDEASSNGSKEAGAEEKIVINVAYGNQPGEPLDKQAQKWKELAEEKSGGKLELKLYPSSQLGSEKDVVENSDKHSACRTEKELD